MVEFLQGRLAEIVVFGPLIAATSLLGVVGFRMHYKKYRDWNGTY